MKQELSSCCQAPVRVIGSEEFDDKYKTHLCYYECSNCFQECDLYIENNN